MGRPQPAPLRLAGMRPREWLARRGGVVLTFGVFDGLFPGQVAILEAGRERAAQVGGGPAGLRRPPVGPRPPGSGDPAGRPPGRAAGPAAGARPAVQAAGLRPRRLLERRPGSGQVLAVLAGPAPRAAGRTLRGAGDSGALRRNGATRARQAG